MALAIKHGTSTAYNRRGCRCAQCRQYKSEQNAKRPAARVGRLRVPPVKVEQPPKHGTGLSYQHGCRCEACRMYKSAENRRFNRGCGSGQANKHSLFCPKCPSSFYTEAAFKEHWKSRHVKE